MKYYAVFTTDYELGCNVMDFDNEEDLMKCINSELKRDEVNVNLIVKGHNIEITPKEVIKEWQIK